MLTAALTENRDPSPVIVSIFLRGAADGLHLVPPLEDAAWRDARPTLAGPVAATAQRLDGFFGLHESLSPLLPLYQNGELAVIHQAGTDDSTRSHFEAEDRLHHGGEFAGGWLGRWLRSTARPDDGPLTAVSLGPAVSDSLRGAAAVALQSLDDFTLAPQPDGFRESLAALYARRNGALADAAGRTFAALDRIQSLRQDPGNPANGTAYSADSFSTALQLTARLIRARAGLRAATLELGGWDSHFGQAPFLTGNLTALAAGLASFRQDLGREFSRVVILVHTEFGRRLAENSSFGTDHGRGGAWFVLGGPVRGGQVIARWPESGLTADALEGPGDLPVLHSMASVALPLLTWLTPEADAARIFPGASAPLSGLLS